MLQTYLTSKLDNVKRSKTISCEESVVRPSSDAIGQVETAVTVVRCGITDFDTLRSKIRDKFRIRTLRREYDTPPLDKRFSVTEISDCLLKVLLRRLSTVLQQTDLFKVSLNGTVYGDLYLNQGSVVHKTVQEVFEEVAKENNFTLICEKYYYDEELELGGKPDVYIPELPLLVEIKSGNPSTGTSLQDPSGLGYRIQLYMLMYLLRKVDKNERLQKAYLWFLPKDEVLCVDWNEAHVNNFIKRFKLLKALIQDIKGLKNKEIIEYLKEKNDVLQLLSEKIFCKYCSIQLTCKSILTLDSVRSNIENDKPPVTTTIVNNKPKITLL